MIKSYTLSCKVCLIGLRIGMLWATISLFFRSKVLDTCTFPLVVAEIIKKPTGKLYKSMSYNEIIMNFM